MGKVPTEEPLRQLVARHVQAGCSLALGGLHFHNTPMAVVREIVRQRVPIAHLIAPVDGSINADMLIGAGLVEELQAPYIGFEQFGMAGRFRAVAQRGELRVRESEEAGFVLGVLAGASGAPFAVLPAGFFPSSSDRPTVPDVNPADYREVRDPFTGASVTAIRAITPDIAVVHCQFVDRRGNGGFLGGGFLDLEIAKAARKCVLLAEELVSDLPRQCVGQIPGFLVDAYCVLEHGAHPGSSHGRYEYDAEHIAHYAEAAATDEGFRRYAEDVIGGSEAHYRRAVHIDGSGDAPSPLQAS